VAISPDPRGVDQSSSRRNGEAGVGISGGAECRNLWSRRIPFACRRSAAAMLKGYVTERAAGLPSLDDGRAANPGTDGEHDDVIVPRAGL
jgi:hypothetical protein